MHKAHYEAMARTFQEHFPLLVAFLKYGNLFLSRKEGDVINWAHNTKECIICAPHPAPPPTQFYSLDERVNSANRERVALALIQRQPDQRCVRIVWLAGHPGASAVRVGFLERDCPGAFRLRMRAGFQGSSDRVGTVCLSLH